MSEPLPRLILFDIDGTLLSGGPQVRELVRLALAEVYGVEAPVEVADLAGKTDERIVTELLAAAGVEPGRISKRLPRMKARYLELLDLRLDPRGMTVLPGVRRLLEELAGRPGLEVGLLTGNWERGARIKLSRVGLDRFFAFGAFGDGATDRRALPPRALAAARRRSGRDYAPREVVIVGDTPHDVDCAHAHGHRALAVATGAASVSELRRAGADWVAADLTSAAVLYAGTAAA